VRNGERKGKGKKENNYSCDLNVTGTDPYNFVWEGGSSSYLSFGSDLPPLNEATLGARILGWRGVATDRRKLV
jgi:hypothetical protein